MNLEELENFFVAHLGKKVRFATKFIDALHETPKYKGLPWSTWIGTVYNIDTSRGEVLAYTTPPEPNKWPEAFSTLPENLCEVNDALIEENQRLKTEEIKRLEVNLTIPNLSQESIDKIEARIEKLVLSNKNESYYDI